MSTVWVHAAAGCAAIASWLYKAPSRHDSRLPGEEPAVAHDCGSSWTILILRMLQVSLRQGSSITPGRLTWWAKPSAATAALA